jgi:hypothetical protein
MERSQGDGGLRAVVTALTVLALIRAATVFLPSMWAWGLNVQRFVAPLPGWLLWLAMALVLVPAVGAAIGTHLARAGDRLPGGGWAPWLVALAAAALVWSLPDRTWFTGDFLLRQGAAETGAFAGNFIQSLPLERLLNQGVPRLFGSVSRLDPNVASRAVEALAAAALGLVSARLAREWGLAGSAAAVAAGTILLGGYLSFFTGLGKPAAVLCVLTAASLLGATRLVRSGRGGALLGVAVALAFLTHRSALALTPLWIGALVLAVRAHHPPSARTRFGLVAAVALPLLAALIAAPLLIRIFREFDLPRHVFPAEGGGAGVIARALAPLHLVDLANLLLFYSPALLTASALLLASGTREPAGGERRLPGVLALSFVPLLLFIHPIQGIFRDLDVFAPAGVACALLAAQVIGEALQSRRLPPWLAPALLASVAVPALQWLLHFHDPALGFARARAIALEAPARPEVERARLWDVLAYRAFRDRQWDDAVEASEQAVRYAPNQRAVTMLAIARTYTGDHRGAESLYVELARRFPEDPLVWLGLGGASLRLGDSLWSARALARLEGYPPGSREARLIRRHLRSFPEVWPTTAESAAGRGTVGR